MLTSDWPSEVSMESRVCLGGRGVNDEKERERNVYVIYV